ncbi:MAG TPA: type II toxin-antitoxin system RelE/ParE family toxin [Candidatus Paceibacterota bacterium]|nr:type II toxin-antitoxin system RelE/ParE family toxin [Candidatus Paceibacterota bacterium]
MVKIVFDKQFEETFCRIKDKSLKERLIKQFEKIRQNPEIGKPMRFNRKGTREVYVGSFRLSYIYHIEQRIIEFLDLYHKDMQ